MADQTIRLRLSTYSALAADLEAARATVADLAETVIAQAARIGELEAKLDRLGVAIKDVCWRAVPYGQTEDGDVAHYVLSKGTVHRLIGTAQGCGIPAAFRSLSGPLPEQEGK